MYTDGAGLYQIPIPAGWANQSTPEMAHFINPAATANLYALVVEGADVQAGIQAALSRINADFSAQPVQTMEIPLPSGDRWTQNVYMLPDGMLAAVLGRVDNDLTYVIAIFAAQDVLAAESAIINQTLLGHTLTNAAPTTPVTAAYVNTESFTEQEIVLTSGTFELPATLSLPAGEGTFPAVVIVHGSGPNDRDGTLGLNKPYRDLAQGLASQGIAVLRYDKRTYVYREPIPGFTVDDEVTNDALAAIALLRGNDRIDSARIFVIGHSLGAMFALRIAERDPALAGAVLMAGTPFSFDQVLSTQINYLRSLDANADVGGLDVLVEVLKSIRDGADPVTAFGGDTNQAAYWASMMDYVPGDTAQSLETPMLILQGERDYQVTMSDFTTWQELLGERENVTLVSYPTLNHIFMALGSLDRMAVPTDYSEPGFMDAEVIADIVEWINQ
ncbi:MAG: alpha/beta fold hydrolase [Anaerolineae bacterium]|nr:alpha/beta fold hydrolase [Anaerolineae bacterium]